MKPSSPNKIKSEWITLLILFSTTFIYFSFFGDYALFYQEKSSLFVFSSEFIKENLHQPGGPLLWLGKLITTFFFYPLSGAFLIAAIITLIVTFVTKVFSLLNGKSPVIISVLTGAALFYLHTDYRYMVINSLGLLIQISLFYFTLRKIHLLRGWIPVLIIPFLYFFTGGFSWVFIILFSLYIVLFTRSDRWIKLPAIWATMGLTVLISAEFIFFQSINTLLTFPVSSLNTGFNPLAFFILVIAISVIPLIAKFSSKFTEWIKLSELTSLLIVNSLLISLLSASVILGYSKKDHDYFEVEKLFYENRFGEIPEFLRRNPSTNALTIYLNNIALCETGQLNDKLFNNPQNSDGSTLFLKWEIIGEVLKRGGYFYYTIGMINEAHRWAFEQMVMKGHTPEELKMLIKTELINGNYKVASRYIGVLKKTLFYRNEALKYEKLLYSDSAVDADIELGVKKKTRIKNDFFTITDDPFINIGRILLTDSLNKKAFDYYIAFLLLKKEYQAIADQLPRFQEYGFTKFPVHVEEAAVALSVMNNGAFPELGKIQLSNNIVSRWNQYLTIFQQNGTNPKAAEPALKKQFGNTFWYWAFYK